jgi:hypothetical protein
MAFAVWRTANLSLGVDFSSRIGVSWRWRIRQSVQAPSGQTSPSSICFNTVDLSGTRFAAAANNVGRGGSYPLQAFIPAVFARSRNEWRDSRASIARRVGVAGEYNSVRGLRTQ